MKKDWHPQEFKKLVTLGESTTAGGWASCRERCWASRLAALIDEFQRVPVELINCGIGANVISTRSPSYERSGRPAADERLDRDVIAHEPDLLVISYGLNDARGGTTLDLFDELVTGLIGRVRKSIQPLILLPGPYYMNDFTVGEAQWSNADLETFYQFNERTREIADRLECLYVDLLSAYGDADWLVHDDGVHANDLGHRIVANRMFEVLASNCSGLARETKHLEQHIPPWRDESTLKAPPA